ncbi:MAG: RNA methyltransferase [Candidatus Omnitrophica bacterium]|nr:RNA methyltransferase [Candidatus Omnitrophota bacterium]
MILYGKNSVFERLKVNPKSIRNISLQDNFSEPEIEKLIKANHIPFKRLGQREFIRLSPGHNLQGITASIEEFQYAALEDLLAIQEKRPVLVFLDRLNDPQNLGAILRTLACFGGCAIVIPKFKACEITEAVLHVAQGGENYVSVAMVTNLSGAIIEAKKSGYWAAGASLEPDAKILGEVSFPFPLALAMGSEGEGIRYGVDKHLDLKVRIPMQGGQLSLNVAAACAVFCYEVLKQRG